MTLATTEALFSYAGDGVTVAFSFPRAVSASSDIKVRLIAADGTITVPSSTVSGSGSSWTVTLASAPASGVTVEVYRDPDLVYETELISEGTPLSAADRAFERVYMALQRLDYRLDEVDVGEAVENASELQVIADGTTTGRTLGERFGDELNVKDFGALGDGTTDDSAAIIAALDEANSRGGGAVRLSYGDYKVGSSIQLTDRITADIALIFDAGARLVAASGLSEPVIDFYGPSGDTPGSADVTIVNPQVDCSAGDSSTPGTQQCTAIAVSNLNFVHVIGGHVYGGTNPENLNADSGFTSVNCAKVLIDGTLVEGFNDAGIYVNGNNTVGALGDGGDALLTDVTIRRCNTAAVGKRELQRLVVRGGRIEECNAGVTGGEITSPSYIGPVRRMDIEGVHFKKVKVSLVRFNGPMTGSMRNCIIEDWGYKYDGTGSVGASAYAVRLLGSRNVSISGNRYFLTDWARDDQAVYQIQNTTLNSILYTHGSIQIVGEHIEGCKRIVDFSNVGDPVQMTALWIKDVSGTYFNSNVHASSILQYAEYNTATTSRWNGSAFVATGENYQVATNAEARAGSATNRLITPANLANRACFSAHKNGTDQTGIGASTPTKVTFTTEEFDTGSYFDAATNSRWTPPAGRVRLSAGVLCSGCTSDGSHYLAIYKNGSILRRFWFVGISTTGPGMNISVIDNANGTDYYELWVNAASGGTVTVSGAAISTFFEGEQI